MKTLIKIVVSIIILIALALVVIRFSGSKNVVYPISTSSPSLSPVATLVSYACNEHKTIQAAFYEGETTAPAHPGEPPTPGGSVALTLSDGRSMTLSQTISADGVRYANAGESFVFWSKGNGALVLENNEEKSYIGCIQVKPDTGGLTLAYQNGSDGFSLRYPQGFTIDESYKYQALGPGKDIYGVKFTIPPALAEGTNLSKDSYMSVELLPKTPDCKANLFLDDSVAAKNMTDGDTMYSVASSTGAAAGNRYEETVYAIPGTNPCIAVRYFIHYGVIQNYPEGTVKEFDKQALVNQFDQIRRTLVINQ